LRAKLTSPARSKALAVHQVHGIFFSQRTL
jgi:hypothetical protein